MFTQTFGEWLCNGFKGMSCGECVFVHISLTLHVGVLHVPCMIPAICNNLAKYEQSRCKHN